MKTLRQLLAPAAVVLTVAACSSPPPPAAPVTPAPVVAEPVAVAPTRHEVPIINSALFVATTGETVRADYRADDTVMIYFANNRRVQLPAAVSASGARYFDAATAREWWEHQGEVTYTERGKRIFMGRRVAAD